MSAGYTGFESSIRIGGPESRSLLKTHSGDCEGIMNDNDMQRYYWRTGQRWSGGRDPFRRPKSKRMPRKRAILLLVTAFVVTTVMMLLHR